MNPSMEGKTANEVSDDYVVKTDCEVWLFLMSARKIMYFLYLTRVAAFDNCRLPFQLLIVVMCYMLPCKLG
jgi:hypothetical protein